MSAPSPIGSAGLRPIGGKKGDGQRGGGKRNRLMDCAERAGKWMISCESVSAKVPFAMNASRLISAVTLMALGCLAAHGQTAEQIEYFEKNVRPVLVANCQPCHNAKTKSSGLDLSSAAGFTAGGAGGALIARDQPESSRL